MIMSPDDIPAFAQNLYVCSCFPSLLLSFSGAESDVLVFSVKKTPEEQTELLAKLDAHRAAKAK